MENRKEEQKSGVQKKRKPAAARPSGTKNAKSSAGSPAGKNQNRNQKKMVLIGAAVLVLVLCLCIPFLLPHEDTNAAGKQYLQDQESQDLKTLNQEVMTKKNERLLAGIESGQTSVFSLFRNALILGDSRAYGFESYGLVPPDQVLADAGNTILNISDFIDTVKKTQPEVIYFSYGVNDMGLQIGSDRGENGYAAVYEEQIDKVLEASPNSKIVINSIIPVTPAALAQSPRWGESEEYNRQIREMCERRGWTFVDNTDLADGGNAPIYQPDGIHFSSTFYPEWASRMLNAALNA